MGCVIALTTLGTMSFAADSQEASVKPYPVPEWMLKNFRPVFADFNGEPNYQSTIKSGATSVFNAPCSPWWWDSKGFYWVTDGKRVYGDISVLRGITEHLQQGGLKALGCIPPMSEIDILKQHPEWQWKHKPNSKPVKDVEKWPAPAGCWYSPFGDFYIKKNVEMVTQLGWDGQILDGFGGAYTACYCDFCKAGYLKATGNKIPVLKEYPAPPDVSDPNYRKYLQWRLDEYDKFVGKWMDTLKKIKPDYVFIPWSTGPGRWWHWTYAPLIEHSETVNRIVDAPILELFWDFPPDQANNLLPSFTVRYYRGVTRENPALMCTYFRSQGQQGAAPPQVENDFRLYTVLTNGGVPFVVSYWIDATSTPSHYMDALKSRQTWTDGAKSVKWAAMLVSQNSRLFYGISSTHGKTDGRVASGVDTTDASKVIASERRLPAHLESAVGVFRAAEEDHLPLDIIIDADLEQGDLLSQYKVLVLPNAACLSDKAVANIRKFVQNGGGLVAMHESSLYTQSGDSRKNFALADLFGASYIGQDDHTARWPAYTRTVALKMRPHEITGGDVIKSTFNIGMDSVDYIGMASKVKSERGVKVIASLDEKPEAPFLILSERDKGKVAYFAGDIGQSYFTNPYQYERKLLSNSLRWAASEKPTVEVTGPMCLQSTFYQQENGKRTIVHLLNEVNSNTNRALPEGNPSMREEIVPLVRIKVLFRDPAITRVHLEPEAQDLPITKTADGVEVTIPELGLHSMVVAER